MLLGWCFMFSDLFLTKTGIYLKNPQKYEKLPCSSIHCSWKRLKTCLKINSFETKKSLPKCWKCRFLLAQVLHHRPTVKCKSRKKPSAPRQNSIRFYHSDSPLRKPTWFAGKSTMNKDVFPIKNVRHDSPAVSQRFHVFWMFTGHTTSLRHIISSWGTSWSLNWASALLQCLAGVRKKRRELPIPQDGGDGGRGYLDVLLGLLGYKWLGSMGYFTSL